MSKSLWPADLGTPKFLAEAYRAGWKDALQDALLYLRCHGKEAAQPYIDRAKRLRAAEVCERAKIN